VFNALQDLSISNLRALAASLRSGPLSLGLSHQAVSQIAGASASPVFDVLSELVATGIAPQHAAIVVDAIADARESAIDPAQILDLVLSGPEVPGITTADTLTTVRTLVAEARREIFMIGYAVHHARTIFEPLAARMAKDNLRVVFCIEIGRGISDTSLDSEIVHRFAHEFREKHWPWPNLPALYYDPRSLSPDPLQRSSLHAKCVIADRTKAIITSANFTEAAWLRNIEVGVVVKHEPLVSRLADYVEGLITKGFLCQCQL
jgi:phosphatidylserine/phosphatidylglycerophosphate/cardiolipin synthase-like enzyme